MKLSVYFNQQKEGIQMTTPYRYDFVGSFLRPELLKEARLAFEQGKISAEELKSVEDTCITELVKKQKSLGYHVITDGEFRRSTWHLDFMWGFDGIEHKKTIDGNTTFEGEAAIIDDTILTHKISVERHPFVDHFAFVQQFADDNTVAKQTMPSPGQMYAFFTGSEELEHTLTIYANEEEFANDIVEGYTKIIEDLYNEGCRNVQFDDCVWGGLVDLKQATQLTGRSGQDLEDYKQVLVSINNRVVDSKHPGMVINTHVCRGNYHSTFFSRGPYDTVAKELFEQEHVDAYYLEYDDERSGGFEPLKYVSPNKKVVLGLVTTKTPKLEDKEFIKSRILQATDYVPLDRLYLSPQCGFASCEIGNKLTEEEQWKKLELVKEIAEEVWGK